MVFMGQSSFKGLDGFALLVRSDVSEKKEVDRYRILRFGFLRILDIVGFVGLGFYRLFWIWND
jgi:hypothetical protein